jgi:hypothetical protein
MRNYNELIIVRKFIEIYSSMKHSASQLSLLVKFNDLNPSELKKNFTSNICTLGTISCYLLPKTQ